MQYNNHYTKDETKEMLHRVGLWLNKEDKEITSEQDSDDELELNLLMNPSGKVQAVFYD